MLKEYIVSLKRDVDYSLFWSQMESETDGLLFVPNRRVDIVNNRDGSLRSCHYSLTDAEANILQNDDRVYSVEIPPEQRTDIEIGIAARYTGSFNKPVTSNGANVNWALARVSNNNNVFGANLTPSVSYYDYFLDGTGVDVVIQDSGLEVAHPEFTDANGNSRVQQIDWYAASGLGGSQNANHYRDFDGHGTHVAGIAAGKNFGWAKNANVYSVKVSGLEGAGDSGTGISITDCFDVIKLWHRNKPVQASTGKKRPTIVNMSWGYTTTITTSDITAINFRGVNFTGSNISGYIKKWNMGLYPYGVVNGAATDMTSYTTSTRIGSVDTDIQELTDEGVHVIIAGGNHYTKIDLPTGADYNNYITAGGTYYWLRGGSPYTTSAFKIGCIDSSVYAANLDQKAIFSVSGNGVDMWAPGSNIMSCCSNTNRFSAVSYNLDSGFNQVVLSGTSQAAPQVCGVLATFLQLNPGLTPAQLKTWAISTASVSNVIYNTGNVNLSDYLNNRSTLSDKNKFLYFPFNATASQSGGAVGLTGPITLTNGTITLT
jgi:subtilisin family serine protease